MLPDDVTEQFDKLADMYAPEDLLPELVPHVQESRHMKGMMILHHPLIIIPMFTEIHNRLANRSYVLRKEQLEQMVAAHDYFSQIVRHERPYRFDVLLELRGQIEVPAEYWRCVRRVWTDSENINESLEGWRDLWSEECPHRHEAMDEAERVQLARMPDTLTIYRGYNHPDLRDGLSWTLSRTKAIWFARRFSGTPRVLTGRAMKRDVLAHFRSRNEDEIVIFPELVQDVRSRKLKVDKLRNQRIL